MTAIAVTMMTACNNRQIAVNYPETKTVEQSDEYFGVTVNDPYRWLEDDRSAETEAWVEAENKVTFDYLSKIPFRNKLKDRLTELTNYEKYGTPFKKNDKYYFYKNDGLQNQSVLYVQESLDGEASVVLDPNKLSKDGTVALKSVSFSKNGKYLAYTISRSGSDWQEIYVVDLKSGELLNDHILWAKFTDAAWYKDGFFYSAYDAPKKTKGSEFSEVNEYHKIYYHLIGTPQEKDQLIFQNPNEPKHFYGIGVSDDEQMIYMSESGAGLGNDLWFANVDNNVHRIHLYNVTPDNHQEKEYMPLEKIGNRIFILTNENAPKYKVMETDAFRLDKKYWKDFLPENKHVIDGAGVIGGKFFVNYQQDASSHLYRYDLNGKLLNEIELPIIGSAGISGDKDDAEAFISFTSFTFPTTIYSYDAESNEMKIFRQPDVKFTPDDYVTEQVFYESKDGTKVPMFITHKKGIVKNGKNPTLIYGYGGFNATYKPSFSTSRLPFLENGGIYCLAGIRGGGEYGEEWHVAGTKMQKQNVFDDFIAAAEYMIAEKYTSSQKLACIGASNGGLLVGAVVNQRPDLYAVAIPEVGVMDMLRYHKFTIGWNWASDYGTSEDSKEMFDYLLAYSPLQTVKPTKFPAMFITTADHDDRVVPAHSFKYAAAVQANNTGKNPTLIRIDTKAGHGGGKPVAKVIEEQADIYSFIFWNLGMKF
ncbi:prolyl endopeptidase [Bacteroidia bacterium]|nr:prolyl endopeptidase [Bacteroidia bacterium]